MDILGLSYVWSFYFSKVLIKLIICYFNYFKVKKVGNN